MGCAGSKRVDVAADAYRPPPTSISLFDISKIEEPWLKDQQEEEKEEEDMKKQQITPLPLPILENLESYEQAPKSWSEVSKALEDLKPAIESNKPILPPPSSNTKKPSPSPQPPSNTNTTSNPTTVAITTAIVTAANNNNNNNNNNNSSSPALEGTSGYRAVKDNSFILRDRELRKASSDATASAIAMWRKKRDPFDGYPEGHPPGKGGDGVVLYTTTLRGVRRTFEYCEQARQAIEAYAVEAGVMVGERDVSLHGEYLKEMKELVGDGATVPRLFIRGRYIGGIEQIMEVAESGKLRHMMRKVEEGKGGMKGCDGCGGARFVPCFGCNGSCKVVTDDGKGVERCGECNENGLVLCPLCH